MQDVRVRHIMTRAVVSIGIHEPVGEVLRLFGNYPLHHLPVLDELEVKGMLSVTDVRKIEFHMARSGTASAQRVLGRLSIENIMGQPVIVIGPDETIAEAASRMVSHAIHGLPVVNHVNHLLGIVTTTDIMQALLHGLGIKQIRQEAQHNPTDLEMRGAIEAAQTQTVNGTDANGIAASLLYLHGRNVLLEHLRQQVARYLRGGEDAMMHGKLLRELDRLGQPAELPIGS